MLLIKKGQFHLFGQNAVYFKFQRKKSILRTGIKLASLTVILWEYLYWGPLCSTSNRHREPHGLALGLCLGWKGMATLPFLQETCRFLSGVIWHFLVRVQPRVEPEVTALISDSCNSANMKSSKIFMVSKEVSEIQRQHLQCTRVPVPYPGEHESWCTAKTVPFLTPEGSAHQHTAFSHNCQQFIQPKLSVHRIVQVGNSLWNHLVQLFLQYCLAHH